jgi:hypothetical protein
MTLPAERQGVVRNPPATCTSINKTDLAPYVGGIVRFIETRGMLQAG